MRIHVIFQLLLEKRKTLTEKINPFVELLCAVPFIIDDLLIALDQICSEKRVLFNARGQALILLFPLFNFVCRLLTSFVPSLHQFFLRRRTSKEEQLHFAAELQRFEEMFQSSELFGTRERQFLLFVSAEHISWGQSTDAIRGDMLLDHQRPIIEEMRFDNDRSIRNENSTWDDPTVSTEILPNGILIEFFIVDRHGQSEKQLIRGHESFEEVTEWNRQISCVDAPKNLIDIHRIARRTSWKEDDRPHWSIGARYSHQTTFFGLIGDVTDVQLVMFTRHSRLKNTAKSLWESVLEINAIFYYCSDWSVIEKEKERDMSTFSTGGGVCTVTSHTYCSREEKNETLHGGRLVSRCGSIDQSSHKSEDISLEPSARSSRVRLPSTVLLFSTTTTGFIRVDSARERRCSDRYLSGEEKISYLWHIDTMPFACGVDPLRITRQWVWPTSDQEAIRKRRVRESTDLIRGILR